MSSVGESESVKERINEAVSFNILTTAEEPYSLKCIWNKTCIYFPSINSGCKTQTIPGPWNEYQSLMKFWVFFGLKCIFAEKTLIGRTKKPLFLSNSGLDRVCCHSGPFFGWPWWFHQVALGESESVKERIIEAVFKSWWPEFLSVSFNILTTAEEP